MKPQITKSENPLVFLNFKEVNVQEITLEQLSNSNHERLSNGAAPFGMFHDDFIKRVQSTCANNGLRTEIYDLFAADKGSSTFPGVSLSEPLIERYGDFAVKATTLRRVFCNLRILDFDTDEFTTNLSIAYHQNGIQVGIGTNVKICHNQCMLNADNYAATYLSKGNGKKLSVEQVLDIVADWVTNIHTKVEFDHNVIRNMRSIYVTPSELISIIGKLQCKRVQYDTKFDNIKDRENIYPLNATQINIFTENILRRATQVDMLTLWDVYNCATEVYKASTMDIPNILPQNIRMFDFLNGIYKVSEYSQHTLSIPSSVKVEDAIYV